MKRLFYLTWLACAGSAVHAQVPLVSGTLAVIAVKEQVQAQAQAQLRPNEPDRAVTARLHVQATDYAIGRTTAYCLVRAPDHVAAVHAAWQEWRQRYGTVAMRRRIDPALFERAMASFSKDPSQLEATLVAQGPADRVCAMFPATLKDRSLNMRAQYPAAYAGAARGK